MRYILFILSILCLTACSTDSPVMGPTHNYEVPDTLNNNKQLNKITSWKTINWQPVTHLSNSLMA